MEGVTCRERRGRMKGQQRTFTESFAVIPERNEWEGALGMLNMLADEINRALCRAADSVEARNSIAKARAHKIIRHRGVRRGILLLEG